MGIMEVLFGLAGLMIAAAGLIAGFFIGLMAAGLFRAEIRLPWSR